VSLGFVAAGVGTDERWPPWASQFCGVGSSDEDAFAAASAEGGHVLQDDESWA
jgi:hypothetical protein